jgi:hypothetical protein
MLANGRYVDDAKVWAGLSTAEEDYGIPLHGIKRVLDLGGDMRDCAIIALEYLSRDRRDRELGASWLRTEAAAALHEAKDAT